MAGDIGPYGLIAAKLVERGYAAIPIIPNSKRPGFMRGGEWIGMMDWRDKFAKRLPTLYEMQLWGSTPAGVGVVAGASSSGLVGIDIDTDNPTLTAAIVSVLPGTSVRKRGAKGETLFFRAPELDRSASFTIDGKRICDVIGPGRQTVLPPSIHQDSGQPYRWTGSDALENTDPSDLPELSPDVIDAIAAALVPHGYQAETPRAVAVRAAGDDLVDRPHRMLNEAALARLDMWVPGLGLYRCHRTGHGYEAVATWRASTTGRPIERRKLNLKISPDGIRDFGADRGYTPINLVIEACSCDLDTAFGWLVHAIGWAPDNPITLPLPATIAVRGPDIIPDPASPAQKTLADLAHEVLGVVGDLIDWITMTARRPNRVLALGAALTIVGTLIGRRVATPTRSGTHLYVVTLAPTGAGKQHALNCLMRAMTAAKAAHHIGPSEFISMPAVINFMQRQPLALCPQDEFGAFLKRVNSRRASGFEASISKALRSIWGASFEAFVTPEWAGRKAEVIRTPAISIYGLSTPDEFYEALQGEDVTNGFLNRFLVLSSGIRAPETTPPIEVGKIPDSLVAAMQELYHWSGSELGVARLNDPAFDPAPHRLEWANVAAQAAYAELARMVERDMDAKPELEPFVARTAEISIRLATIRAAGRWGRGAAVDLSDVEWGLAIAKSSAEMMASDAMARMVVEMSAGRMSAKIVEAIKRRGGSASRRDIMRMLGRSVRKVQDIDDVARVLVESGVIELTKVVPPAGGPPTIFYRLIG